MKLVYIAGQYRAATAWGVEQNIRAAEAVAYRVAGGGCYPVCPHTNTRGYFEETQREASFWLEGTLELMRRCDAVVLVDGWPRSSGARAEREEAIRLGLPIFRESELYELARWARGET